MENCNIKFPRSTITLTAIKTVKGKSKDIDLATQVFELDGNPCFVLDYVNRDLTRDWSKPVPGMTIMYNGNHYLCSDVILPKRPKHPILMTRPLLASHISASRPKRSTITVTPVKTRCELLDAQMLDAQVFEMEDSLYFFLDKSKASLESKGFIIKDGFLIDYAGYRFQCTEVLDLISPFRQILKAKLISQKLIA